ncbi:MAG: type II toxin-antitoxin system RelE/ParE family toxin [Comamonadaceae bacterium CG_4_9_14_3_um_filter_60_33]|nr:MAG: type II toxin-antitoxin system RelE/ParE family toxin [Comamonadaceae bacterium CG_4_10_14_3_um_filter_60_42]PJB45940.1 MAG: type II toxin-antitoxin system RelE/ParE family toxin [Comamonadaceae bacterium CG_4_9_14_3_um_filter_60_33]
MDFKAIKRWTTDHFGAIQAVTYAQTIILSLKDLCAGPKTVGCKLHGEIGPEIYTLHVARQGRPGRHVVVFRANSAQHQIDILRILHDSMDLPRHLALH